MRSPAPKSRGHYRMIDSMRGLAALSVVAYHVSFRFAPPHSAVWQLLSERGAGPPMTAVIVFFLISGFVLYRPFVAARFDGEKLPSLLPYTVRRVARIVPAYWIALAITAIALDQSYVFSAGGIVRYFGFLQLYGKPATLSGGLGVAWTLCIEVTFYAALPLLAWVARRVGRGRPPLAAELRFCAALALASIVWQGVILALVPGTSGRIFGLLTMLPGSLDLFAAGMAFAAVSVARQRGELNGRWLELPARMPWACWLVGLALIYTAGHLSGLYQSDGLTGWWLPTHELKALAAALLLAPLIIGAEHGGAIRRALSWRPLVWVGAVSYGIYLWHQPLLDKLGPHLQSGGELVMILVVGAAAIVAGALSFYVIERPAQRLARRWLSGSRPVDAVGPVVEQRAL